MPYDWSFVMHRMKNWRVVKVVRKINEKSKYWPWTVHSTLGVCVCVCTRLHQAAAQALTAVQSNGIDCGSAMCNCIWKCTSVEYCWCCVVAVPTSVLLRWSWHACDDSHILWTCTVGRCTPWSHCNSRMSPRDARVLKVFAHALAVRASIHTTVFVFHFCCLSLSHTASRRSTCLVFYCKCLCARGQLGVCVRHDASLKYQYHWIRLWSPWRPS